MTTSKRPRGAAGVPYAVETLQLVGVYRPATVCRAVLQSDGMQTVNLVDARPTFRIYVPTDVGPQNDLRPPIKPEDKNLWTAGGLSYAYDEPRNLITSG
jgi:hypothetical protein